jgi:hypothetical protein
MKSTLRLCALPLSFLVLLVACGEQATETAPPEPASSLPGLPEGHPPIASGGSGGSVPPPPAGSGTGTSALEWQAPEGWIEESPATQMRKAQYRIEGPEGAAECVIFYFGPGQGGDAQSNAARWASQFAQPDGRDSRDVMKTSSLTLDDIEVLVIEVAGTYVGGMGGPGTAQKPGYMLLGAVATGPDANWFFKLTGPQATVEAQNEAFLGMVRSLKKPA